MNQIDWHCPVCDRKMLVQEGTVVHCTCGSTSDSSGHFLYREEILDKGTRARKPCGNCKNPMRDAGE